MSWLDRLDAELRARGVPRRDLRRIHLELSDHIACEPGCEDRLGDPRSLAITFAEELATARARGSALTTFTALALTAAALTFSQLTVPRAGGYPTFSAGLSLLLFMPALFGMLVAPQAALVAGGLAALRALRRRRVPNLPAAEIALINRRARIALVAGSAIVAGLELYVVDFSPRLPGWWVISTGGLGAAAGAALVLAWRALTRAQTTVSERAGRAGDLYDDLPLPRWGWLRNGPWRLGALAVLAASLAVTMFEAHAEHSLLEGVQRGTFEALAAAVGLALLGRAIGAVPVSPLPVEARLHALDLPDRLITDADRARAEAALRDGFAHGRVTLDELERRLEAVHAARTSQDLRAALEGLPPPR